MKKLRRRLSSTLNPSRFRSDEGLSELSGRLSIQENGSDPGSHTGSRLSLFSRATQRFSISSSRIPDLPLPAHSGDPVLPVRRNHASAEVSRPSSAFRRLLAASSDESSATPQPTPKPCRNTSSGYTDRETRRLDDECEASLSLAARF
ncbi:hypothetical protein MRX96_057946 [Rhipicephalus microplus]